MLFLADINTQVRDDINANKNDSEFHILEFHLPTLGVDFSITLAMGAEKPLLQKVRTGTDRSVPEWICRKTTCPRHLERPPATDPSPGYKMYRCELPTLVNLVGACLR